MKFTITIEEMVSQDFEVEAADMEEALELAEKRYKDGKYVLSPGNLVCTQMSGFCQETGDAAEWIEF